ncbi:MAG TPA: hypothetical protein VI408_00085 [Gaiellaceae bacterium]
MTIVAAPAHIPSGHAARVQAGCSRCVQTESWWSTAPYRDPASQLPPHRTMARLGPRGIIVHITRSWEPSPPPWEHTRRPIAIRGGLVTASFEGNTTRGRVSLWQASTWRSGSFVTVWVLFGRPRPTAAQVRRAQRVLDATRYPVWRVKR